MNYRGERMRCESVWCCRWQVSPDHDAPPYGVNVPGWRGGDAQELCEACEAKRLAELDRQPEPEEARD